MANIYINPDIAKAATLEKDFYVSDVHFEASKERIFARSWQLVGSDDLVAQPNSAFPFILLGQFLKEPLLLIKDSEGVTRCMSNVCTHRANLLVDAPCSLHHIRCRYHGRQFRLDGSFVSMPEFKEVENFPAASDNLHQLPLFKWGNLIFTSLTAGLNSSMFFGEMTGRMHWYPMENLKFRKDLSKDYQVAAHWALYCENYLEGFHIPFVHEGLNQELDFGSYTTELFSNSNLQLGIGKTGDECFDLPESSADFGKQVAAYYFWVFPNMMFNFYPWGLSVNVVVPVSKDACKVSFLTYVLDEEKLGVGAGAELDVVEQEDEEVVQQVQQGINSRFYTSGRYSVTREQGIHHFHSLLAKYMD
jgi:choline monooxygenase